MRLDRKRLPTPEPGAIRSYLFANRFIISLWNLREHISRDSWTIHDPISDFLVHCWSYTSARAVALQVLGYRNSDSPRFSIRPLKYSADPQKDCVLMDLETGRWWHRAMGSDVHQDIETLTRLADGTLDG